MPMAKLLAERFMTFLSLDGNDDPSVIARRTHGLSVNVNNPIVKSLDSIVIKSPPSG